MLGAVSRCLDDLAAEGGLNLSDIANIADVPKAMVTSWKSGRTSPPPLTELILSDLRYLVRRLQEYYSANEIRAWLHAKHEQLEGRSAINFIRDRRSIEVLHALKRLESAAYL